MDAYDLFRQLTRGAKFTKKKPVESKNPQLIQKVVLKEESLNEIKEEEENGSSEEQASFQLIEGVAISGDGRKKKMKKSKLSVNDHQKEVNEDLIATVRKENRITVFGKNIPPPISNFEELGSLYKFSERLQKNLAAYNYPRPTPIQMQAIPIMMQGRPLMACAPTGSGKTIAFLTPIINDLRSPQKVGFRAIILAPTRELAKQIYREAVRLSEKTALKVHIISKENLAVKKLGPNNNRKFDILISTPNRVRYLLQQEPPMLDLKSVEWFVIDEADRLMEDGPNNFREQMNDILAACPNSRKKLALFSATYTVPVAKWALKNLKNLARLTVGQQNAATETVNQELLFVGFEGGKLLAFRDLMRGGLKPPVLVFVQSKDRAKQLFQELLYDGINVDVIHADRTQQQRDNCVRAFREGNIWVLICTELMGRGIDFKGVNLVVNYDFPLSTIAYIHRIGRSGRGGRAGKAITFFTQDDTPNLKSIAQIIKNSGGKVPDFLLKMKPNKGKRKFLASHAPKREDISTRLKVNDKSQMELEKVEKPLNTNIKGAKEDSAVPSKKIRLTSKDRNLSQNVKTIKKKLKKQPSKRT